MTGEIRNEVDLSFLVFLLGFHKSARVDFLEVKGLFLKACLPVLPVLIMKKNVM